MLIITWFIYFIFPTSPIFAASPNIPEVQNPKHEIGFACLKEIQANGTEEGFNACYEPFVGVTPGGERIEGQFKPPAWAKKTNGAVLTRDDWQKIEFVMTGYEDGYGFKVFGTRKDSFELRLINGQSSESIWIPKNKLLEFYSLSAYPVCGIRGNGWWKELRQNDLKTGIDFDLTKKIPGDPYKGLEPIGVLEVHRNGRSEICQGNTCTRGQVSVDSKIFNPNQATTSRGDIRELNLGFEHFSGLENFAGQMGLGYLVAHERRTDDEFLLQSIIYNKPKIWVKLTKDQRAKVKFLPVGNKTTDQILASPELGIQMYSQLLLQDASFAVLDSKWQEGQFWYKVKILPFNQCDPEFADKKSIGEFWIPYSSKLIACPKGC